MIKVTSTGTSIGIGMANYWSGMAQLHIGCKSSTKMNVIMIMINLNKKVQARRTSEFLDASPRGFSVAVCSPGFKMCRGFFMFRSEIINFGNDRKSI